MPHSEGRLRLHYKVKQPTEAQMSITTVPDWLQVIDPLNETLSQRLMGMGVMLLLDAHKHRKLSRKKPGREGIDDIVTLLKLYALCQRTPESRANFDTRQGWSE